MSLWSQLFPPAPTVDVEGEVERVGPLLVGDSYGTRLTGYALLLRGNPHVFHVLPRGESNDPEFPQAPDLAIALAQPGDLVSFAADERHRVRLESFENHTVTPPK